MPLVTIEGPIIKDMDTRRKLVKEMTRILAECYELPEEIMLVLIKENKKENVGHGGVLISDMKK